MKKTLLRLCALILSVIFVVPAVAQEKDGNIVLNYSDIFNCVVNGLPTAVWERTEENGKKLLRVAPNTESELYTEVSSKKAISLDSWGLDKYKIDFTKYKYVTIEYKYTSKHPADAVPQLYILKQKVLSKTVHITADDPVVSGSFAKMTFYIPNIEGLILTPDKPYISQLHFFPFGDMYVNELDAEDSLLVGNITFSTQDPKTGRSYTVTVDGKTVNKKPQSTFTLPESTVKDGYIFKGYIPASGNSTLVQPGESIVVESNISFTSHYVPEETVFSSRDIVYGNFKDYYNCIVDGLDTGFADTDGEFLTARAHPYTKNRNHQLKLDGWDYGGMRIAPLVHKYAYVLMKVEGANNIVPSMNVMKSDVFTKISNITSATTLKNGEWCFAEFDISSLCDLLIDAKVQGYVKQIHFLPFGKILATDVPFGAKCYIDKIIFSKEKLNLTLHDAVINGYPDGTFKPESNITRAECAALVQRAAKISVMSDTQAVFGDVQPFDWYYGIVSTLADKNIIDKEENFRPNELCTRAEFTDMIVRACGKKAASLGTFSDVFSNHKYYNSIREASGLGFIKGYPDGTFKPNGNITRAEAASVISNFAGRKAHVTAFENAATFTDDTHDHWCVDIINELSVRHIMQEDTAIITDIASECKLSEEILNSGNAKKAEVDALFEQKKKEILGSPTEVVVKGTKYYVSNSGNDDNDGLSPDKAWKTVEKVNSTKFKPGDGVYFERGGLWRTELICDKGVTYTAYGKGEKPRFYGSPENGAVPENWTLVDGTDNIWQYHLKMYDVGGIVIGSGERVAEKVAPRMKNGTFFKIDSDEFFDYRKDLEEDLTFFCDIPKNDLKAPDAQGYVYLRCDKGNPGEVFDDIEFITRSYAVYFPKADTVVDNLCAMYAQGGINGSRTVINATVQNCEVGYIGGNLQGYDVFSGTSGNPVRYGNGINFYGECDGYYVYNNYIHDVYDAGISNQYAKGGTNAVRNDNIEYSGNIIERCNYGIEYFMGSADAYVDRIMTNMHIHDNIIRDTGYGFGRKNPSAAAAIKGWDHNNHAEDFTITNNIFCNSYAYLYHIGATYTQWLPTFSNNVYIQKAGAIFGKYGRNPTEQFMFDPETSERIKEALSEDNAEFYYFE